MLDKENGPIGTTVYLRPQTKMAPQVCYLRLAAVVVGYTGWPMMQVRIPDMADIVMTVHKDNVALHPAGSVKTKGEGDGSGQGGTGEGATKPAFRPHKPLDLPSGWIEEVLF